MNENDLSDIFKIALDALANGNVIHAPGRTMQILTQ